MELEDETISGAMEVVSLNETHGEMESVVKLNILGQKIILINFISLYTTINEYEERVASKYKIQYGEQEGEAYEACGCSLAQR